MSSEETMIENFRKLQLHIANLSVNRPLPRLVAVSKTHPASKILSLHRRTGHEHFGENYMHELAEKAEQIKEHKGIKWHFIGRLQRNKIEKLVRVPNLFMVETLDSCEKANLLNNAWTKQSDHPLKVMLQTNSSGEAQKGGLLAANEEKVIEVARYVKNSCPMLHLAGLMTIGSMENGSLEFDLMAKLARTLEASDIGPLELSMGMSGDYEEAIMRGSTSVRIGSLIFGSRT